MTEKEEDELVSAVVAAGPKISSGFNFGVMTAAIASAYTAGSVKPINPDDIADNTISRARADISSL
jgi:hypothetical protein